MTQQEMNALVVHGIGLAVPNVCDIMLGQPAVVGQARQIGHPLQESDGVVALVGMAGAWIGTGALCCRPLVARRIAESFLLMECPEVNDDVLDAVSELANIVIGNLKTVIEEKVGDMGLSTPTTIYGASFTTKIGGSNEWILVPIEVCGGEMLVQVCILPNLDRSTHRFEHVGHMLTKG
jgi:chemotaxis protein CheX